MTCLLLGQATAVSENLTSIENGSVTSGNNTSIIVESNVLSTFENNNSNYYENDESVPPENHSSKLFSLAPLNPEFEEYLEK